MQSNNPIFRNSKEFNGQTNAYGNQTYPGNGSSHPNYGQGYGQTAPSYGGGTTAPDYSPTHTTTGEAMTVDSVVQRTGLTLLVVMIAAAATWVLTGDIRNADNAGKLFGAMAIGSLGAFGLSMVNSFKRVISPALVLAFAALEGVALGALSKYVDATFIGDHLVVQAVIGTFAAFGGTLAAYKFFNIQVGQKFRTFVIAAVFGMVGLSVLEMVLSLFHSQLGLFDLGKLGLLFSVVGLVLGVFMLILDFDFVERGIEAGLPERESWRAAFGLTVSLVWIYTNLLRILMIINSD